MNGVVSFHPVDPEFFESTIEPLVLGEKIDPGIYLSAAARNLVSSWEAARYKQTLELLRERIDPAPPPQDGTIWEKVRTRLERFDHRPELLVRLVAAKIDPELHLNGRPYLITEGSAESVASMIEEFMQASNDVAAQALILEQLVRLDPGIAKGIELGEFDAPPAAGNYRTDLLGELRVIYDLARAAREDQAWGPAGGRREPARAVLARDMPWKALKLHSRAAPFWVAEDVDGLDSICRAAAVEPPPFLVPAWSLFVRSCEVFPEIRQQLGVELAGEQSVGAYVSPAEVPDLLIFLNDHGSRIIQAATQQGVGPTCTTLLRKIRECACFASRAGVGYIEASGILPVGPELEMFDD